jgi:hypothetical protein
MVGFPLLRWAGVFGVDASGRAWVSITVPISLDEARAIAVTEEP